MDDAVVIVNGAFFKIPQNVCSLCNKMPLAVELTLH